MPPLDVCNRGKRVEAAPFMHPCFGLHKLAHTFYNIFYVDSEGVEELSQQVPVNNSVSSYDQSNQEQHVVQDSTTDNLYYADQGQTNG